MRIGIFFLICYCCFAGLIHGQSKKVDSLLQLIETVKEDTAKVNALNNVSDEFLNNNPDTAIFFAGQARALAIKLNYKMGMANASLNIGLASANLGNYEKAMKNDNDAVMIYDQLLRIPGGTKGKTDKFKILNQKARAYSGLGRIYSTQGNHSEALKISFASLKIAEETGNKHGIASSLNTIGLIYYYQGNFPEALKKYFAAIKINKEIGDRQGIVLNYCNIGSVYGSQGNYPESLKNFLGSLKISEEIGDKQGIARCNGNIGLIYFYQGNFTESLKSYSAALKINQEIGEKTAIALNYGNIGINYGYQGNYSEALKNQFAALKINEEIGDKNGIALNYGNIGNIYEAQGNYPEALKNQFAALKICEEIGDKSGLALSYNNIGEIYTKQKNNNAASQYLNKSLSLAKEIGSLEIIKNSYNRLSFLDSAQGNFNKSLEHYKMYVITRDSMYNKKNTEKLLQLNLQYEFDKKESLLKAKQDNKDALALRELQSQKLLRNFFIGLIGLLLLLSFLIYRAYHARQLLRMNDIRNKIAGDLHDDIGSTLNSISIYSEVAKKKDDHHDEALEMIGDASRKVIEAMSDIVWTINAENDNFEKIIFRMKSLTYNLFRAKSIEFTFHADEILNEKKLSLEQRRNFYLVFKEAVNNLVKYSNATRAAITLTNEDNRIRLRIQDNGVGFDTSQENTGNGLKNMKRRAEEIEAEFNIESQSGGGTHIELTLKA